MGYMQHHAIVVTSWDNEAIESAHAEAVRLNEWAADGPDRLGHLVTEITAPAMNGFCSFLIAPDGSKEGWGTSNQGDQFRAAFVGWLDDQAYNDGSSALTWALVQFGDDNQDNRVLATDDDHYVAVQAADH